MKLKKSNQNPFPGKTVPSTGKESSYGRKDKISSDEFNARRKQREEQALYNEIYLLIIVAQAMEEVPNDLKTPEDIFKLLAVKDFSKDLPEEKRGKYFYRALEEELDGHCLHDDLTPELKQKVAKITSSEDAYKVLNASMIKAEWGGIREEELLPPDYDTSQMLRIGFDGFVNCPKDYQLSEKYLHQSQNRNYDKKYNWDSYNFKSSDLLQKMMGLPSYKDFDEMLRKALSFEKVPPEIVKDLNISDVKRIVFNYRCANNPTARRANVFNGARNAFISVMGENHAQDFGKILKNLDVTNEEVEKVVTSMKERGCLPPLIATRNGTWIEATVHHKRALKDTQDLNKANDIENFMLVFDRVNDKNLEKVRQERGINIGNDDASKPKEEQISQRFPRYHELMHKLDEALSRSFRSKQNYEKRQSEGFAVKTQPAIRIEEKVESSITIVDGTLDNTKAVPENRGYIKKERKPIKVRRIVLPDVACLGGFGNDMTFRVDQKDIKDFNDKIGNKQKTETNHNKVIIKRQSVGKGAF